MALLPLLPSAARGAATDSDVARLLDVIEAVGPPYAVIGRTLASMLGWPGCGMPAVPQLAIPATRTATSLPAETVRIRRVQRWDRLVLADVAPGIVGVDTVGGVLTVAADLDDGELHTVLQDLHFRGAVDLDDILDARRQGLPGCARVSRVLRRYLFGLDSPKELEVYNVLGVWGRRAHHLNAYAVSPGGVVVGPFDGLDDDGAAYEVDSVVGHGTDEQRAHDATKSAAADSIGLELVRFWTPDIAARAPMVDGWDVARAVGRSRGLRYSVMHEDWRACPCGHRPPGRTGRWVDAKRRI